MAFHVLNRGVGRRRLFLKAAGYEAFGRIVEKTLQSCPIRICVYVLMCNHWHCYSGSFVRGSKQLPLAAATHLEPVRKPDW
jgi:hypothetical protein